MDSVRSVCMEVPENAIVTLHSRLVLCSVCGSFDGIESTSKYSSSEISSDHCLIWVVFSSLESLSELEALKISLRLVIVGAELG